MSECLTLKKSNCKNCYKCIRHCPVKSIRFSANQAHIIGNECILCGQCFVVCPQNAKRIVDETEKVKVLIQSNTKVIASIAPSFIANYQGIGINGMRSALKKLGFFDVEETAIGADVVKKEYERLLKEGTRDVIISSCCHSINLLIQKYFPKAVPYLADIMSPMQVHSAMIKKKYPDSKTVFIGPCVSKKDEAEYYGGVDAVLTFEELSMWLKEEKIELIPQMDKANESKARLFPVTGGIIDTMKKEDISYTYLAIDGVENCIRALKEICEGNVHKCFIEMSACKGSCVGGPVMEKHHQSPIESFVSVKSYAGEKDFSEEEVDYLKLCKTFDVIEKKNRLPEEEEIKEILKKMGKNRVEDELNCGSCGYDTCREKAIAIFQGKAEISMCLPYLKEKAESFSDSIVKNTPNGLIVVNESLEVQQINPSARKILNIHDEKDVLGEGVVRILNDEQFLDVLKYGKEVRDNRVYLADYDRFVEETITHDEINHILMCIMRDVTEEENERAKRVKQREKTIETADKVVSKQMRIVQEIASLLGETAAETKIALTKLKEGIQDE